MGKKHCAFFLPTFVGDRFVFTEEKRKEMRGAPNKWKTCLFAEDATASLTVAGRFHPLNCPTSPRANL